MATIADPTTGDMAAVKPASTAPLATDKAFVVAISPNSAALAQTVAGAKSNNAVAPGATNIGTLPAVANAAAPTDTETFQTTLSVDLAGTLRTELTKVAGTATSTAAAGVQKVGIVGNAGAIFDAATAAAVPANGIYNGLRAATANPTNATGGNMVGAMGDKAGRMVATLVQVRELVAAQQTNIASTSITDIVTAGGASVFRDLIGLIITTAGAAAQTITISDNATTKMVLNYPNGAIAPADPLILMFPVPIPQAAANTAWRATQSVATACNYTAIFANNL